MVQELCYCYGFLDGKKSPLDLASIDALISRYFDLNYASAHLICWIGKIAGNHYSEDHGFKIIPASLKS